MVETGGHLLSLTRYAVVAMGVSIRSDRGVNRTERATLRFAPAPLARLGRGKESPLLRWTVRSARGLRCAERPATLATTVLANMDKGLALKTGGSVSSVPMAQPAGKPVTQRWLTWAAIGACALAVWFIYGGARHFHFLVWDDDYNIQQNTHLNGVTAENLRWMFTDTAYARRYLPLTWLGWAVEHDLFGLTAKSAHLGNILVHLLNTVLVFLVIQSGIRLWSSPENRPTALSVTVAALLGALIWSLHPLRVEVVAWASGRIYAQSGFFLLLATWCYFASLEAGSGTPRARRWRWASVASFALSLLTYPLALTYVGVLLAVDWYRPKRPPAATLSGALRLRTVLFDKIPFFVVTALILFVTLWARANVDAASWKPPVTFQEFGIESRAMQAAYVWAYYLVKPFFPIGLSPFYTRLIAFQPTDGPFVASLVVVGLLTAVLFWRRQRWPGLWLLWLCHLIVLTPMLGLTEHPHFTNDRYSYLAAVPWSVAVGVGIVRAWSNHALRVVSVLVASAAILGCCALTLAQVSVWRDTETLGLRMIALMGDHTRRFDIYGRISAALRQEGKVAESNAYYLKYLAGDPHAAEKSLALGKDLEARGQTREATVQYLLASELRPDLAEPRYRLGTLLLADNKPDRAVPFLRDAVRLQPDQADVQVTLGWALLRLGQPAEALPFFATALRLASQDPVAHTGMGVALVGLHRPQEALPHLEEALQRFPNAPAAHFNLGTALEAVGRTPEAAAQFEAVLKLQPDYPGASAALARTKR
jgi:hypothetical protein